MVGAPKIPISAVCTQGCAVRAAGIRSEHSQPCPPLCGTDITGPLFRTVKIHSASVVETQHVCGFV